MRILVVEDDPVSNTLLTSMLTKYGETDSMETGTGVVTMFVDAHGKKQPYDLICLDIMLPGMDGQEILKQIRLWEEQSDILGLDGVKIIMITALSDRFNIMEAFRSQCEGYIVKPIRHEKVREQLIALGCIEA